MTLATTQHTALTTITSEPRIELAITAWLDSKRGRSGSVKTLRAYSDTLHAFRAALQAAGLDVDGDSRAVSLAAQGWAGRDEPAPATYNQRLAILSSFYDYAEKQLDLGWGNPIRRVERRKVQAYADVQALTPEQVREGLRAIDRSVPEGMRDYVLLRVAVVTGWRVNELASLRGGDVQHQGGRVTLHCRRAKGAKVKRETVSMSVSKTLLSYLSAVYGASLGSLDPDAPIWMSWSRNQSHGNALSVQAMADISHSRLGVHFHALRHTFARTLEDAGAKVSDIQARLGHESLATTGKYLAALKSNENPYSEKLDKLFDLED